jgi:hypothetical protein
MSFVASFFMQKLKHKEGYTMFSDDVLEKIFAREELQRLDLQTQSAVIHAIEEVLEQEVESNGKPVSE